MSSLVIENGRVVDPASGFDRIASVYVEGQTVAAIGERPPEFPADAEVIDATGHVVAPGFVDLHAHLREPGFDHVESIETGGLAAVAGGFTTVCCLPDTRPVNDNAAITRYIIERAREAAARVKPIGAISKGMANEEVAAIGTMREAGAVAISDDGNPVMNARLMRRAMQLARDFGMPVMTDCEDQSLAGGGVVHEGVTSTRMGLRGIPALAEDVFTLRNLQLARETGATLHISHLSTARSLRAVREARAEGVVVTCDVSPHHLALTDEMLQYDGNYKVKPPLRPEADREALRRGIADGTIDAIATDHQPHAGSDKMQEFDRCPFGILGFETAFVLALEALYHNGLTPLPRLLSLFTSGPAHALGLACGRLEAGARADLVLLDLDAWWQYDVNKSPSKSRNTPFSGRYFQGRVVRTLVNGKTVYKHV
ncbi:MAG: dihydroorotase [Bryobacterales bacterium]|nr:dihydroorotase [Bryobacterales bacterium]